MALHYKTCTIQYAAKTDGTPATGYVEFKPNTVLTETDTGIILNDYAIVGYLDETGKVTVSLLVCDSPGVEPTGWSWNIEEKIDGGSVWWFQIFDSMEEPINLKDLYIPGSVPPTVAVQGPKGDTGDKGDKGDTGPQGPEGPEGQAAVIVGNFDRDPADLPPDGYVPANWDSPGKPPADTQILVGQAFLYNPNGHLWSFVGQTVVVAGWQDIGMIVGPQGEKGETGPLSPEDIIAGANITVVINANDTVTISAPTPVVDHGNLQGLADDDHTQYHNNTRGDARYDAKGTANSAVNTHVAQADPHTQYLKKTDTALPEVEVGTTPPTAENILLFVDTDAPSNPNASWNDMDARYVNQAGDTLSGRLGFKQGIVPGVTLSADVDFGSDQPTLMVLNEDGLDYAQVALKSTGPTHLQHAANKKYVDDNISMGTYGFSCDDPVNMPGANSMVPFNFSDTRQLIGHHLDYFYPLTDGYVRIRKGGRFLVFGDFNYSWSGDGTTLPAINAVVSISTDHYIRPYMWLGSVTSPLVRAFGGVRLEPAAVNIGLANYYVPNPGIGDAPILVYGTVSIVRLGD